MQTVIRVFDDQPAPGERVIDREPIREYPFDDEHLIVTIGAARSNDITLKHRHMSEYHAVLVRDPERSTIGVLHDLASMNGTLVEGVPITQVEIRKRLVVRIQPYRLEIILGTGPAVDDPDDVVIYGATAAQDGVPPGRLTVPASPVPAELQTLVTGHRQRDEIVTQVRMELARLPDRATLLEWLVRNVAASLNASHSRARLIRATPAGAPARVAIPAKGPIVHAPLAAQHQVPRGKPVADGGQVQVPLVRHESGRRVVIGDWTLNRDAEKHGAFSDDDAAFLTELAAWVIDNTSERSGRTAAVPERAKAWPVAVVGASPAFRQLMDEIRTVGNTPRVLLLGPPGVGKTFVAAEIHRLSGRARRFRSLNCATGEPLALEEQIFGGSGALPERRGVGTAGLLEQVDRGTAFMDEIAEMHLRTQAMLNTTLSNVNTSTLHFTRMGENTPRTADVQLVFGTNKDLDARVKKGSFLADLLTRVKGTVIRVPTLKERIEDVPLLAYYFLDQIAAADDSGPVSISREAMKELRKWEWSGNIREVQAVIVSAYAKAKARGMKVPSVPQAGAASAQEVEGNFPPAPESVDHGPDEDTQPATSRLALRPAPAQRFIHGVILVNDLPPVAASSGGTPPDESLGTLKEAELAHILKVLEIVKGDRDKAEEILGMSRTTLLEKLDEGCVPRNHGADKPPLTASETEEKRLIGEAMRTAAPAGHCPATAVDPAVLLEPLAKAGYRLPEGKTLEERLDALGIPRRYPCSRADTVKWWRADAMRRAEAKRSARKNKKKGDTRNGQDPSE